VAAAHAQSQVYPDIAHFQAFFAASRVGMNIVDLIDMRTGFHLLFVTEIQAITSENTGRWIE